MRFVIYDQDTTPAVNGGVITYTAKAHTSPYTYSIRKTFQIPLNFINTLFDIDGKFYDFAFSKTKIQLDIKLRPHSLAKLFFTEQIVNPQTSGIEQLELFAYIKKSQTLTSDMNEKG